MVNVDINTGMIKSEALPPFSLNLSDIHTTAIYSDAELQNNLVHALHQNNIATIFDRYEGLYERLTIKENIRFYHKWFGCRIPLPEILVLFKLHNHTETTLNKCSESVRRRVYFAKHYMTGTYPMVFQEPIHGADINTIDTFINMLQTAASQEYPVLVLVSNMEHALLLGDIAYKLQGNGLHEIEIDHGDKEISDNKTLGETLDTPSTTKLFKIPAKVEDKVILFDPTEIDYIESREGKSMIVINDEAYAMDTTLAETERMLEIYGFYRCHRSYIVNLQKVREIITWSKNTYSLRINNQVQSTIPLTRTKIQAIQEMFSIR